MKLLLLAVIFHFAIICHEVQAEGECLPREPIMCYHCDSKTDKRCRDPFNNTFHDSSTMKPCKGCCVKLTKHSNTPQERIMRLCTKDMEISLFMVDYVCLTEHDKTGTMCFCEEDLCNKSSAIYSLDAFFICNFIAYFVRNFLYRP